MATFKDLERFIQNLPQQVKLQAAQIIAETATEDFKQNFTRKSFDGKPWPQAKNPPQRGTLMVRDAHLVNSIKPVTVTAEKVVIAAGDSMAPYAKIHNEGFIGGVTVKPHSRASKATGWATNIDSGKTFRSNTSQVQAHTRRMKMPRRRFMGYSRDLEQSILNRLQQALKYFKL